MEELGGGVVWVLMGSVENMVTNFGENEAVKMSVWYWPNYLRRRVTLVLFRISFLPCPCNGTLL